ncbi:MAG: hypothetical protein U1C46_09265 [Bacteroidales bacterium]|nr:hypothetical protein [Bacteroidales bacterium]MDZ4204992.1 hypothetical protein [Bacteroidales bacterium]
MGKQTIRLIYTLGVALFITSCKLIYFPTTHNTPMLSQKGELQLSGLMDGSLNFELQSAYAVSDNVGIMLNGSYKSFWLMNKDYNFAEKPHTCAEAGIGYYKPFVNGGMFEIYGGGGIGRVHGNVLNEVTGEHEIKSGTLTKFYVQPAVGMSFERRFLFKSTVEYNMGLRISAVNLLNETKFFAEPGFVSKTGGKSVRLISSVGYSFQLHKNKLSTWVHNPFIFGFGIQVAFGRKFDRK